MVFDYLLYLLFNAFDTYFLDISVILNWIILGFNVYFYVVYNDGLFLIISIFSALNVVISFFEDYNIFNIDMENQLSQLVLEKSSNGLIMFNDEGLILMINDNFKKIFQNNEIINQFDNINNFINGLSDDVKNNFQKNVSLANQTERIIYYDLSIHNNEYMITFEKIKNQEQFLFLITCQIKNFHKPINNAVANVNNNLWQDIINNSADGNFIIDNNEKLLICNKKFLEITQKESQDIKYNFLKNIINDPNGYLTNYHYHEGIIIINNKYYIWKKQKIDEYYWFTLTGKTENTQNSSFDPEKIIFQNPIGIIVFDKESLLFINETFKTLLENPQKKFNVIEEIFVKDSVQKILSKIDSLKNEKFIDVGKENFQDNLLKSSIKKIRIYPVDLGTFQVFNIIDISHFADQEQQLFHAQRLMTTGEILSGIIHDLNNYLMPILGYTESIFTKINVYDPIYNNMIHLQNNAVRAANLVKYLLNMSRKHQNNNQYINHLNLKIAELLRSMSKVISKNIEIKFKQGSDIEGLSIGEVFLEQILTNILINSRDAIVEKITENPNHKGLIYITTELLSKYFDDNDGIKIIIYDNGKGISGVNLKKIFDPFYTTKDKNGIGLGLATVKKIIEEYKGKITINSQEGVSTEISIILPSCPNKDQKEEKSPYITGKNNIILDTGTILIVEDEQSIRRLLKEHLTKTGYKVLEAENGADALKLLENYNDPIDLLVSDVMLPDMSVVAMVKNIQKKYPNILIILSSGTTEDQVEDIIQKSFQYTFLNKPFPLNTIINAINHLKNKKN